MLLGLAAFVSAG